MFTVLVPIATKIMLSFTGMDPKHQSKFSWVGIQNYKLIALGQGLAGEIFWYILFWTVMWTLLSTTLAILIGFTLSLLANNERVIGKTFFRTVYILPWAVPAFITIMFFSIMFSPDGALTEILNNIMGRRIEVKSDPTLTRIVLILLQGWLGSAYVFLLSTGVLQGIPGDLYEAADIDGATAWQKVRHITLPIILFQTAPLLVGQYTFNFNNFSIIYLFNGGGPFNPSQYGNLAGSSDLLISYIFKLTMENQYQSIGAAITSLISIGLMFFAYLGFRNSKAFKEERL
jgi:arabinogalactan oligomer/maltooligosaccharide transport system permease protein